MEELGKLIQEAEELKNVDYRSPRFALWENRVKRFVEENYGNEYVDIFDRAGDWGRVITPGEGAQMHLEAVERRIEFLNALKNEPTKKVLNKNE